MCRLSAITSTEGRFLTSPNWKSVLMYQTMLLSQADEDQAYGSGVSDGRLMHKAGWAFSSCPAWKWFEELHPGRVWVGHNRKPSAGTSGSATAASHPYLYDNQGNPFVLFHNGFFWPTGPQLRADEPNTDTYRAGTLLEALADGENITRQHILDWLSAFSTRSSSSVIIMQGGRTLLVRGQRPLYYAHVGNGSVVNTSETVLQALKGMSEQILGFPVGQIRAIPEDTLTLMSPGERISQHYKLRYQYWPHLSAVQTRVEGDYEVVVIDGEIPEEEANVARKGSASRPNQQRPERS
jgi:predicted glutamine amidotransferase